MRKKHIYFLAALSILFLLNSRAQARKVWLDYTDGQTYRCDNHLSVNDIYTMKMTPYSPAKILQITFKAENAGTAEVHFWQDLNGMPNINKELMTPVEVATQSGQHYYGLDLKDQSITIDPPRVFHVGLVRKSEKGASLCMDYTPDWAMRAKYRYNGEWTENEKDWFVKVYVDYYNEPTQFYFSDTTEEAGITRLGGRMAWGDYDNDGYLDLLISGNILYHNNGDGTFTDVSDQAGISSTPSNGGVWADFNNDGLLDFFAMVGSMDNYDRFFQNNGDGTFTDITDSALIESDRDYNPSEGAAWGDYDKDGFLDLYLANYELPGDTLGIGTRDRLYHNNGDGTFTDVAPALGIDPMTESGDYMCGRGVNWADYNDDLWPDIYVSNYRLDPNFLWQNNGGSSFTDVSSAKGVQGNGQSHAWGHTIGSAWADFNNDGYLDLFTANLAHPLYFGYSDMSYLYLNNGPPDYTFTDATKQAHVIYVETNSEPCWGDWNNDGWIDLLITNVYDGFFQQLYRNNGDGTLTDVTYFSGLNIENGWGATFADYDEDGFLDIISNKGLYRNNGNDNHWVKVKLECNNGDPFCIGTRVELQIAWDKGPQAREVSSGKGTTNGDPFVLHFGLNQCAEAWRITAKFLNGKNVTRYQVAADQTVIINEDDPSDSEPTTPTEPSTCANVDYTEPGWPEDDDNADDDSGDSVDDDIIDDDSGIDDDSSDDDSGSDNENDSPQPDDDGNNAKTCGC